MGAPQYEQAGADIGGSGTTNTIPRWTGASTLGDSIIIQGSTANAIGIGNAPTTDLAGYKALEVGGLGSGFVNADNDLWITANAKHSGGGWKYAVAASTPSNSIRANAGAIIFNRAGNGTAGNALTWLESARIDSSGNVGIGTASPQAALHVVNNIVSGVGATTTPYQHGLFGSSSAYTMWWRTNATAGGGLVGSSGPGLQFYTAIGSSTSPTVSLAATIDSTGNLLMAGNGTAANPIIANSTGVSGMYFPSAATVAIAANGAIAATFSKVAGAGVALGGTTGLVFDASGSQQGVKLRATPDSLDSQTLDCYQDGGAANSGGVTWTPALRFGGATTGITGSQVGRYTRIGNMVFAQGTIALSSKGSATGAASIAGLPTSANVVATIYYSVAIGYNSKVTFTGQLHGLISVNSGIVELYQTSTAGVVSAITNTDFAADSVLTFTVCYPVT